MMKVETQRGGEAKVQTSDFAQGLCIFATLRFKKSQK